MVFLIVKTVVEVIPVRVVMTSTTVLQYNIPVSETVEAVMSTQKEKI